MPFLPFVLLIAWQALSRSTRFALGWATSLYFGEVPGRQGRLLSVVSLMAVAWLIVIVGFAVPILAGAILEAAGVIDENFEVTWYHYLGLMAAVVALPPAVAATAVYGNFHAERSVRTWLGLLPRCYTATLMLGLAVLQMVAFTPILLFQRWRAKRKFVQVPLALREGADDDDLVDAVRSALGSIGIDDVSVTEADGIKAWPMRTVGYAVRHLLGAVVRGDPMRLAAGETQIYAYATNISITGPKEDVYRIRAAVERELAFCDVYLTWSEDAQALEDELMAAHDGANGDVDTMRRRLDDIQQRMDTASLNGDEWNVLYRLRLQVEQAASRRADGQEPGERIERR
ncbi:MAG TPA: hypothetical protein VM253_07505 [Candidatus Limnocylindrales bacterium]|nr:hypothetical protein [Candidatus Limnocylindrales bacterium]